MGIALAKPIVFTPVIRGDTTAHLRADVHAVLSGMMPFVAITNGFAYTMTNPDGLTAILEVWEPFLPGISVVSFRVQSIDNLRVGYQHNIDTGAYTYWMASCPCQLFLAAYTIVRRSGVGNSVQLGVPFAPNVNPSVGCAEGIGFGTTTEAWWSCGDAGNNPNSFRWTFYSGDAWSACFNGQLIVSNSTPYTELSRLLMLPPALATRIPSYYNVTQTLFRGSNSPLYADPLLCWGTTDPSSVGLVRGQPYNCVMPTVDKLLDSTYVVDGISFINYMHDDTVVHTSRWSSLLLMKANPPAPTPAGRGYVY